MFSIKFDILSTFGASASENIEPSARILSRCVVAIYLLPYVLAVLLHIYQKWDKSTYNQFFFSCARY